ncbi:extensin-like domain-containing protein [Oceanibium sediminis]|uniref:extensin-like domain-containing protein n=1 Tax=Oceanibium sediminis TaxID=2026339 RepID=UPI000DD37B8E|nr:extensin family protein [Oceanibium sediminis]
MFPNHLRRRAARAPAPKPARQRGGGGAFMGRFLGLVVALFLSLFAGSVLLPGIPSQYNILAELDPEAPPSPLTRFKVMRATATPEGCLAMLERIDDIRYARLLDRQVSDSCHITGHVQLRGLSGASMAPVSTTCETALRLYLWERHSLQPAARDILGQGARALEHQSSYNCRRIRTDRGEGAEMSSHATASAIDIKGVILESGRHLTVQEGWRGQDPQQRAFWRALRDGACRWFGTVLGPDFNQAHADHFHMGQDRYGACR